MQTEKEQRLATAVQTINPAVLGLAGFGGSLLLWQFYNLGWVNIFPVVALGFFFGGLTQLIAGFLEMRTGNNFGFCAFGAYGAFWISMSFLFLHAMAATGGVTTGFTQPWISFGWFLFTWTIFTALLLIPAIKHHSVLGAIFTTLLIGFIMLDVNAFWVSPTVKAIGACILIVSALLSWYLMMHILSAEVGIKLPLGAPRISVTYLEEAGFSGHSMRPSPQAGSQASPPSGPGTF